MASEMKKTDLSFTVPWKTFLQNISAVRKKRSKKLKPRNDSMIGKIHLIGKGIGVKRLLLACLVFSFLTACQTSPKWTPHEGKSVGLYPDQHWHKVETPEQLGWSSEKLAEAHAYSKQIGSSAVMIVDDGVVVDAWGDITRRFQCHSMRKSLLSALIGVHVEEGHMDLSKTMADLNIKRLEPSLSAEEEQATVGDLIKARSGIYIPALGESPVMRKMRPKRHSHSPGSFWYYNNWDFNALGTIFEQETGAGIFKEFERRFAKPIQMEDFDVSYCRYLSSADYKNGPYSPHRYYLFRASARDLARVGLLFLRDGKWQDQQIVPTSWIKESTASHSKRGKDGGYGYMWWTGVNRGLLANVNVKAHSYYAAGWGGHRVFVLPYRKLVVVHRVNTDEQGPKPMDHHIGRLLWLILSAAGETQIGEDPSIEAATGTRLSTEDFKQFLANGSKWIGDNNGIFPGGDSLVISCSKKGELSLSASKDLVFKGKWWIFRDRFCFKILGIKAYFTIFQEGDTLALYDPTGTLYGKFTISDT
jgi:CubicO group peptidase (beta-lactamase class C family)